MSTFESHPHGHANWIDLTTRDGEAAAKWYGALFGWTAAKQKTPSNHPYWMFPYQGHTVANIPNTWCWNEHDARDVNTASMFYADLFGWTVEDGAGGLKLCHNHGNTIALGTTIAQEWGEMPPMWAVYVTVVDTDETCESV
ncbi:MAG: putative enzyme related to lactoylglutathione lyase [Bradymonadia bacterium]|jgi:predicted enzyme related to lactoylglutathione lyase